MFILQILYTVKVLSSIPCFYSAAKIVIILNIARVYSDFVSLISRISPAVIHIFPCRDLRFVIVFR
jgi:hypothetical protein